MVQITVHVLKEPIVNHSAIQIYEGCSSDARNLYLLMLDDIYYHSDSLKKSIRKDIEEKISHKRIRNVLLKELLRNKLVSLTFREV